MARRLATLAVAVAAFAVALAFDANGFIAAFVAGIAFGALLDARSSTVDEAMELPELGGEFLALVVWFLFGATLVPLAFDDLDGRTVLYALASLTVIRMLPVALSLVRSGLDRPSVVFIGWFGPRGLASVVFALLAIEELGDAAPEVRRAVATVALTVLLSVLLHGITARPGGRRYVQLEQHLPGEPLPGADRARSATGSRPGAMSDERLASSRYRIDEGSEGFSRVFQSSVLRGRPLSWSATASRWAASWTLRSVPLRTEKYWRSSPLVR